MKHPCLLSTDGLTESILNIQTIEPDELDRFDSRNTSFWLVDMSDPIKGWKTVCQLRSNLYPAIYLRPIVYLMSPNIIPDEMYHAANGHIKAEALSESALEAWTSRLEPINLWIEKLDNPSTVKDTNIAFRMLRLIACDDKEIAPSTTTRINSGFVYPRLEPLFTKEDNSVFDTLNFLLEQKLINSHFISKAHFCGHCESAFLNFKETCSQCNSEDIQSDDIIHHFKCAHTGELSDFRNGDELICPKCERTLQHIGVDYDKPSIIFNCNQCSHSFQEPEIQATCFNCGRTSSPENLIHRTIHSYTISAIGKNAAIYGLDTLFTRIMENKLNLTAMPSFKAFYAIEASRIQRYKVSTSSLTLIHMENMSDIYIRMGGRSKELFEELSIIFRTTLRTCDVITALNESTFFIIMTETSSKHAKRAIERISERVSELLDNNLGFTPEIKSEIYPIDENTELDTTLENFQRKHVS